MSISNAQIAELLRRYASTLVIEGVDPFKVKAYRRAAASLETISEEVAKLVARGTDLQELPGVGKAISEKITVIVKTGKLPQLEKSLAKLEPDLAEIASRPALDPKRVLRIYKKFGIHSLAELKERLESGEIRAAFDSRMEFHVRQGLDERPRMLLWNAEDLAIKVESFLQAMPEVVDFARTGSLRRKEQTVGDLNFLVTGKSAATIFKQFAKFGPVQSSEATGRQRMRFLLSGGRSISLAFSSAAQFGLAMVVQTGSAAHLVELKAQAKAKKLTLTGRSLGRAAAAETLVYERLGLPVVEPELREGRGEVAAAAAGELPRLVELGDLRGDLHMHTTSSDGAGTLDEMAKAARARGYAYIAITDHSQSLKLTNGLSEKRLFEQIRRIDKYNARQTKIVLLKSAEVDILEDGRLDYSDAALKQLDFTICSIHSRFSLNRRQQTERIMRAMDNTYFNILGHATGRLLLKREGYDLDVERIIAHAAECGCYFEINSSPDRLDLSDEHAKLAKQAGVKIAVNTDAHSIAELDFMTAGINQARRAWLEKADVLNTLPLAKLRAALRR